MWFGVYIFKLWFHTWHSADCYTWVKRCVNVQKLFIIWTVYPPLSRSSIATSQKLLTRYWQNLPEWCVVFLRTSISQNYNDLPKGPCSKQREIISPVAFDIPSWIFVERKCPRTDTTNCVFPDLRNKVDVAIIAGWQHFLVSFICQPLVLC